MLQRIKELLVWLRRIGHCRGFGIQSPTDYRFVCEVINGKDGAEARLGRMERRLCGLYLRIARYQKPRTAVVLSPRAAATEQYIRKGCPAAEVLDRLPAEGDIDLLIAGCGEEWTELIARLEGRVGERSLLVLEGIYSSREKRKQWEAITADERVAITFDLYYVGIAVFDRKRYKQNYIVNF